MTRIFVYYMLLTIPTTLAAQNVRQDSVAVKGIIADMLTKIPQRDIKIMLNNHKTVTTSWDGSFCITDTTFRSATIIRDGYLARKINREEFTDTIFLIPTGQLLDEVIVYGNKPKLGIKGASYQMDKVDIALMKAGKQQGFNPLGVIDYALYAAEKLKLIPKIKTKSKKEKKQEKRRKTLEDYDKLPAATIGK